MTTDMTALVTRQDLADHAKVTKQDMTNLKQEILDGVAVLNENLLHNFQSAFNDRTQLLNEKVYEHDQEIVRIKHFLRLR